VFEHACENSTPKIFKIDVVGEKIGTGNMNFSRSPD
jgi:hypothetical protein